MRQRQSLRNRVLAAFACVAVIATALALMIPAISMTRGDLVCGLEEHEHTDACYEQVLICGNVEAEDAATHEHTDACYETKLVCDKPAHKHSDACYEDAAAAASKSSSEKSEAAVAKSVSKETAAAKKSSSSKTSGSAKKPAQSFRKVVSATDNASALAVDVAAPKGAFDAGTKMTVKRITDPETLVKMASALEDGKTYSITAVDISFSLKGKEVEPDAPVEVDLKTELGEAADYQVVHLKDDDTVDVVKDVEADKSGASFTLDSFSAVGAAAVEQDIVPAAAFQIYNGSSLAGNPDSDLTPGAPSAIAPVIPGYVFVNATANDGHTDATVAAQTGVEVTYVGSFISGGETYVYYRTATDANDLIVHVEDDDFIQLNYKPADNYYNINYALAGDTAGITLDDVFGADRVTRMEKNSEPLGYTVTIPRGYTATITRNGSSVETLGTEPTYTVSNNKVITKNGELLLEGTYTIPKTSTDQNIVVTLTKRNSFTFDASKFLSTVYTGGNSTTMGDNTVNTNSNARIQGDGSLGRNGTNKGKKTFTGNEVSWSFTTNNTENSHWLLDALQINGTDINVPYGESGPVSKETVLPSGAVVTVTLNSVTGSGRNARRNYTIAVSNVYEDVVISGGNIYNADNSTEIITEVLNNVKYSFYGFSSSDNAYSSSVRAGWVDWGEGEPIGELTSGTPQNSGTYTMYWFGTGDGNRMRFTVDPGYVNPELALVTSTEGDLHNYVRLGSGLSFGGMSDSNGKYYSINGNPDSSGHYYFYITGIGNNNKLALLRIRATLAEYEVTYDSGSVPAADAQNMPEGEGGYNVETKDKIVLSANIPVDSTGANTFAYYWTIAGAPQSVHYAPGQEIDLADVVQYAVDKGNGKYEIPFVAHWTPREQAEQVNYHINFDVKGSGAGSDEYKTMMVTPMMAPEGSAIYVNRDSEYISNFLSLYHGLLEYDEENSASYVSGLEEGSEITLCFNWVRHPVIVEKQVDSVVAADATKNFDFSLSSERTITVPYFDNVTGQIDPSRTEEQTDAEPFDNFALKHTQSQEFNVMREATLDFTELEESTEGFTVSYLLTTFEDDGTTVKEERTITPEQLAQIKVTEKMKITVINEHGRVNVEKRVAVTGDNIQLTDVSQTIYMALRARGASDFVSKNGSIYTVPVTITNGVATPSTVTFTGIPDGEYEVWELSDASGTSLSVGDIVTTPAGKTIQVAQVEGVTSHGIGNNITITNNGTDWARFTNTYSDASDTIFFRARKRWMDNNGNVGNQYAPAGGYVIYTIYQEIDGVTSPVQVGGEDYTITLDGTADTDGEESAWWAKFDNLPRLDGDNHQIKYKVRETFAPAGYVAYKAAGTSAEYAMAPDEYLENNGGTIYNRRVGVAVKVVKVDQNGDPLEGATFTAVGEDLDETCVSTITAPDPAAVIYRNDALAFGSYTFTETDAPAGYIPATAPVVVTVVDEDGNIGVSATGAKRAPYNDGTGVWVVEVMNTQGYSLPTTGGPGTWTLTVLGALLIAAGAGVLLRTRRDN